MQPQAFYRAVAVDFSAVDGIIKFRRRKHHMKRMGHRQWFTEIKITGIQA